MMSGSFCMKNKAGAKCPCLVKSTGYAGGESLYQDKFDLTEAFCLRYHWLAQARKAPSATCG